MKNTTKTTKNSTIRIAGRDQRIANISAEWLEARGRNGRRHVEVLGWTRLAAIYYASKPGSAVRKSIEREARRCGYTPRVILAINAE